MAIHPGFVGHGIFISGFARDAVGQYSGYSGFVAALKDMAISRVWLQLFSISGDSFDGESSGMRELLDALIRANVVPVGLGYCVHENAGRDVALAADICRRCGITAFVANIEPDNEQFEGPGTWDKDAFVAFVGALSAKFGKDNLAISTSARLDEYPHTRQLMPLVADQVGAFALQIYWTFSDPITFTEAALASWRQAGIRTPLVGMAQSYWNQSISSEPRTPPQAEVEASLASFVDRLPDSVWSSLIGLNWYHAGRVYPFLRGGGMSNAMIAKIAGAKIDKKPFKQA